MNLATYIKQSGLRRSAFAEQIGVSPTIVTQWCAGDAWPSADMAARIFDATDGQVTPNDFLADRRERQSNPAEAA